jgi:hypothetical protein
MLSVLSFSCSTSNSTGTDEKLPSGHGIKIISMNQMGFQDGQVALVLNYETQVSIDDLTTLRAEAEEVWDKFRHDVEGANLRIGILKPVHYETSGVISKSGRGYGFVIEKRADGQWHWVNDDK